MNDKYLIRKVDGLGRIVIPKEIRSKLNITENDYLELISGYDYIVLKKYSRLSKLGSLLQEIVDATNEYLDCEVLVIEKDKLVAYSGINKDIFINKIPSKSMIKAINRREELYEKYIKDLEIIDGYTISCSYINKAIICNNEVIGLICLYRVDKSVNKKDLKIVNIVVSFINNILNKI